MITVKIVLDEKLFRATDEAARHSRRNRSALVRDALRNHLRTLEVRAPEERDREGYARRPHCCDESVDWEAEATWPEA